MNTLSEHTKKEIINALNGKQSGAFTVDDKLISIEVENNDSSFPDYSWQKNLSQEIEDYSELKESLSRYLDNPSMKRYSGSDLKDKRHEKRK